MRHLGACILFLGLAAPALAADAPPAEEQQSIPWYRWLFLGERTKPMPPAPAVKAPPPPSREAVLRMMAAEQNVYQKRLEAISKIKELALERGDEAMLKKADELERQAEATFTARTSKLQELTAQADERSRLETPKDNRPATAERPTRRPTQGDR